MLALYLKTKIMDKQESRALTLTLHFTRAQFFASHADCILYYRPDRVAGENSIVYELPSIGQVGCAC